MSYFNFFYTIKVNHSQMKNKILHEYEFLVIYTDRDCVE